MTKTVNKQIGVGESYKETITQTDAFSGTVEFIIDNGGQEASTEATVTGNTAVFNETLAVATGRYRYRIVNTTTDGHEYWLQKGDLVVSAS